MDRSKSVLLLWLFMFVSPMLVFHFPIMYITVIHLCDYLFGKGLLTRLIISQWFTGANSYCVFFLVILWVGFCIRLNQIMIVALFNFQNTSRALGVPLTSFTTKSSCLNLP